MRFFVETSETSGASSFDLVWHFSFMKVLTIIIWCITLSLLYLCSKLKKYDKCRNK